MELDKKFDHRLDRGLDRRDFLKGSVAIGGLTALAGLAACAPSDGNDANLDGDAQLQAPEASFETPPEPIADSAITETVEADVVVVGSGDAGIMAALAAVETGARVVMIDKHEFFMAHGLANACINTKIHKEAGITLDPQKIISYLIEQSGNQANQQLLWLWANKSGEVYDHLLELVSDKGITAIPMGSSNPDDVMYPEFDAALLFVGDTEYEMDEAIGHSPQTVLLGAIVDKIQSEGCTAYYQTTAEQLVRNPDGRVDAVIARTASGDYTKFTAAKAVVLATGDYGNNPEMVEKWCPWAALADVNLYAPPINTGDGHKMALWIGAGMQLEPHCPALHPNTGPSGDPPFSASPVLRVNALGERYENEEMPAPYVCTSRIRQPENKAWAIVDANYAEDAPRGSAGLLRTTAVDDAGRELLESVALKADSIPALASAMGVPADTLEKTVARYTELAKAGRDEDFGKSPNNLWAIEQAPFYAIPVPVGFMNTLGGLRINTNMQVLDNTESAQPIPGLYAAGNVSGGLYGTVYPSAVSGINKGWSVTGGYLAGQHAANDN
ncbi:MAG: FAD-dependent oxidoreductase [Coriobacteriales bacterium]|nr:FAD-dependent oxidoreductase [Coriobacteriales bacterium]